MESSSNAVSALHQSLWSAVGSSNWSKPVQSSLSVQGIKGNNNNNNNNNNLFYIG